MELTESARRKRQITFASVGECEDVDDVGEATCMARSEVYSWGERAATAAT